MYTRRVSIKRGFELTQMDANMYFLLFLPILSSCHSPASESTTISGRLTTTTKRTYFSSVAFNQTATYSVSITDSAVTRLTCALSMSSGDASLHVSASVSGKTVDWWSREEGDEMLEFKASDKVFKGDKQGLVRNFDVWVIGSKRDSVSSFRLTITLESNTEYADHDRLAVAASVLSAHQYSSEVTESEKQGNMLWWGIGALAVAAGIGIWRRQEKGGNRYYPLR